MTDWNFESIYSSSRSFLLLLFFCFLFIEIVSFNNRKHPIHSTPNQTWMKRNRNEKYGPASKPPRLTMRNTTTASTTPAANVL